ncbi:hypothetical protein F1B92_03255 [Campylobacter sp. FMV-PI01]|uniref:Neutral zinc metallopeptidase n=1 Tax=Campylobacter portucalensis TaxID=2608384 RepID=A0A6L5WKE4_9BACT|nr:neutral zinc metallopeptidase [Campylobacter portucalensis]MSN96221.1 hypothetical protein [Campylobacter portucalensis]
MKWRGRKGSSNIEDLRNSKNLNGIKLQILIPLINFLIKSKIGRIILIIGVVAMFFGYNPLAILNLSSNQNYKVNHKSDEMAAEFVGVVLAQTEEIWHKIFASNDLKYIEPKLVLFRGGIRSACGFANSQVGPFYCPADMKVYLDLGFFDELAKRHDAPGDFAAAYVVAHEVGHHIQNLTGLLKRAKDLKIGKSEKIQNQVQVGVELMADCYAGIWAYYVGYNGLLEDGDIEEALNAASMIGDDILQKKAYGKVIPDSFTHGSAKQRKQAFYAGYKSGDMKICDFKR